MAKNIENFRDQLAKLAESVELLENTFISEGEVEIKVKLNEQTFNNLMLNLNNQPNSTNCVISIGSINFTFLKK
jgi:hypothetical protein